MKTKNKSKPLPELGRNVKGLTLIFNQKSKKITGKAIRELFKNWPMINTLEFIDCYFLRSDHE